MSLALPFPGQQLTKFVGTDARGGGACNAGMYLGLCSAVKDATSPPFMLTSSSTMVSTPKNSTMPRMKSLTATAK